MENAQVFDSNIETLEASSRECTIPSAPAILSTHVCACVALPQLYGRLDGIYTRHNLLQTIAEQKQLTRELEVSNEMNYAQLR